MGQKRVIAEGAIAYFADVGWSLERIAHDDHTSANGARWRLRGPGPYASEPPGLRSLDDIWAHWMGHFQYWAQIEAYGNVLLDRFDGASDADRVALTEWATTRDAPFPWPEYDDLRTEIFSTRRERPKNWRRALHAIQPHRNAPVYFERPIAAYVQDGIGLRERARLSEGLDKPATKRTMARPRL